MNDLNPTIITEQITQGEVLIFKEINSTNDYLIQHARQLPSGSLCLAESQTAGRGRRGRQWYSPESRNLYFSMLWHYPSANIANLSSLSLVTAILVAESLSEAQIPAIQIKWPNDIYYQGKKMGGILIESKLTADGLALIVGIGLNLGMKNVDQKVVTQAWSDLSEFGLDRSQLVGRLAPRLQQAFADYAETGFGAYLARWQRFDIFRHQAVKLVSEQGEVYGTSLGVDEHGELILQQGEIVRRFNIGEVSLRAS